MSPSKPTAAAMRRERDKVIGQRAIAASRLPAEFTTGWRPPTGRSPSCWPPGPVFGRSSLLRCSAARAAAWTACAST
jgi:hypothetical protein